MCVCVCIHVNTCVACIHMFHANMYAFMRAGIHTHIHTYAHMTYASTRGHHKVTHFSTVMAVIMCTYCAFVVHLRHVAFFQHMFEVSILFTIVHLENDHTVKV